jgi:Lon protease-like protein
VVSTRETLPLFPLSNVVLFPGLQTPLHVFEPRYRQLTEHALAGGRRIGMVTVRPEHVPAMAGDPPLFEVGCEGRIEEARRLHDGRFHILLAGTQRFRVRGEAPREAGRLYRLAEIERLEDAFDPEERPRVIALRHRALELLSELLAAAAAERPLAPEAFRDVDDAIFVNALSNALGFAPVEKQGLLEAGSIPERFERLVAILAFQAGQHSPFAGPASGAVH